MKPSILAAVAMLAMVSVHPARAEDCPGPTTFTVGDGQLPATSAAIARRHLTILILGGAATAGSAAHGADFTYPARLAARLRERVAGLDVVVKVQTAARRSNADIIAGLEAELRQAHPALVIWGLGAGAAAHGEDLDAFARTVEDAVAAVRAANADVLLMTVQYAPSLMRLINLAPYRTAVVRVGDAAGVPVFDRYEFMRYWDASGLMNLDAIETNERIAVARKLFDCMADVMATGIVDAVH